MPKDSPAAHLESILHEQIPLARAMEISVDAFEENSLILSAPLEANTNHKQTAFGGSLYSLAVLTGWGLLYLKLREQGLDGHIVIHRSEVRFEQPVKEALKATCRLPEPEIWQRFLAHYRRRGKARLELTSTITTASGTALIHQGQYVVHR